MITTRVNVKMLLKSNSEGFDSDNAALQIMATDIESDDM